VKIGLAADSLGDLDALQRAFDLLVEKMGATRLFFLGGRWGDVDDLVQCHREVARGGAEYSDANFLADVASFVEKSAEVQKGGVAHRLNKDALESFASRFTRVPDKDCLQYRDPAVPRKLVDMIGDRLATLVHDKADLAREDIEPATFIFHGGCKAPAVVQIGARYFITPGSLSGVLEPTCALISQGDKGLEFIAFALDGRELKRAPLSVAARGNVTVR